MMNKSDLRKHYKALRNNLTPAQKSLFDNSIAKRFLGLSEYIECNDLLVYVSEQIEVDTKQIISESLKNKRLLCPRCVSGTNLMHFYVIDSFDDLEKGAYGILEPVQKCTRVDEFSNVVCIVPGLSFDSNGFRLGFGKGYYDRFLSNFNGTKIGLCYECCLNKEIPCDEFDIPVDILVTEDRVVYYNNKRKDDKLNG